MTRRYRFRSVQRGPRGTDEVLAGMRISYLATNYPFVSHTFIQGEIAALRADAANGRAAISLFRYSISYLTLLFAAVAVDAILRFPLA